MSSENKYNTPHGYPESVRFWHIVNGSPVKLTLAYGGELSWYDYNDNFHYFTYEHGVINGGAINGDAIYFWIVDAKSGIETFGVNLPAWKEGLINWGEK